MTDTSDHERSLKITRRWRDRGRVETLRELLPEIEGGEGPLADEDLGRLLCILKGWTFARAETGNGEFCVFTMQDGFAKLALVYWHTLRPDISLDAADDLCRECGYIRQSRAPGKEPARAAVFRANAPAPYTPTVYETEHPTSEPRAILSALVRARIAELEAKQ